MYTLSSNILKWSYNQKNVEGQHFEGVSHSIGYYSMVKTPRITQQWKLGIFFRKKVDSLKLKKVDF